MEADQLLSPDFDYRSFAIGRIKYDAPFHVIHVGGGDDIFVRGGVESAILAVKYAALKNSEGIIHRADGASFGIRDGKVKWVGLRGNSAAAFNQVTGTAVRRRLGEPDALVSDGIQFVADFVPGDVVLVYNHLKLHVFMNPQTDVVIGVAFGDLDGLHYDTARV